eukprot:TRINITY_DN12540_c0_g1_i1.p1 TRINITY_DN12540_c0_g1~~TRINITY_DN12540_c0_g1_i1.p1  ORF type:complete len:395 (+),score=63.07 TRINITY_DN12540_c0_g1_i1:45-1229(+)
MHKAFSSEILNAVKGPTSNKNIVKSNEFFGIKNDQQAVRYLGRQWSRHVTADRHAKMLTNFYEMQKIGVVGQKCLEFVIEKLQSQGRTRQIRKLVGSVDEGILSLAVLNQLIEAVALSGQDYSSFQESVELVSKLGFQPNIETYNSVLKYYARAGDAHKFREILSIIDRDCVAKTADTFHQIIRVMDPSWEEFDEVLKDMCWNNCISVSSETIHALVESCCKKPDYVLKDAHGIEQRLDNFIQLYSKRPVLIGEESWLLLARSCASAGFVNEAFVFYEKGASQTTSSTLTYLYLCTCAQTCPSITVSKRKRLVDFSTTKFNKQLNLGSKDPRLWMAMYNVYKAADDMQQIIELMTRCSKEDQLHKRKRFVGTTFAALQQKHVSYLKEKQLYATD